MRSAYWSFLKECLYMLNEVNLNKRESYTITEIHVGLKVTQQGGNK